MRAGDLEGIGVVFDGRKGAAHPTILAKFILQ